MTLRGTGVVRHSARTALSAPTRLLRGVSAIAWQLVRPIIAGISWWADFCWRVFSDERYQRPQEPAYPVFRYRFCVGMGPEDLSDEVLGIHARPSLACDRKKHSQVWLRNNFGDKLAHGFTDNSALLDGRGTCWLHGGGECMVAHKDMTPDWASGGFPCPPYSPLRNKAGNGMGEGPADTHPDFATLMHEFPAYLAQNRPRQFWIEEVPQIADGTEGDTHLDHFLDVCSKQGYACRAMLLDHGWFCTMSRLRMFIWGVSVDCGGDAAADWGVQFLERAKELICNIWQVGR